MPRAHLVLSKQQSKTCQDRIVNSLHSISRISQLSGVGGFKGLDPGKSKTQRYPIYDDIKQGKVATPHI